MPITPTYPGVYIEEIPSGVRTITGVATSIAAFIDYFKQGPMNKAVQVFNLGDFSRIFGGLDPDSEASYAIQQFFLNGGTEAWIVRTASGDVAQASVDLLDGINGLPILTVKAIDPGEWGNNLRVTIDRKSADPANLFNLTVAEYTSGNGASQVARSEVFRNLSLTNVEQVINDPDSGSKIIEVEVPSGSSGVPIQNGTVSGDLSTFPTLTATTPAVNVTIGTEGTHTATFKSKPATLEKASAVLEAAIRTSKPDNPAFSGAKVEIVENKLRILAGPTKANARVSFSDGGTDPTVTELKLDSASTQELTGILSGALSPFPTLTAASPTVNVTIDGDGPHPITLTPKPTTLAEAATALQTAIRAAQPSKPAFSNARVATSQDQLVLSAGIRGAAVAFAATGIDPTVTQLKLDSASVQAFEGVLSGDLTTFPTLTSDSPAIKVTIGGEGPHLATLSSKPTTLAEAATTLQSAISSAHSSSVFTSTRVTTYSNRLMVILSPTGNVVPFSATPADGTTVAQLKLDSVTAVTGILSGDLSSFPTLTATSPAVKVTIDGDGPHPITLTPKPTTLAEAATALQTAIRAAQPSKPAFSNARVATHEGHLVVSAGIPGMAVAFAATATDTDTVTELNLDSASIQAFKGVLSGDLTTFPTLTSSSPAVRVTIGSEGAHVAILTPKPTTLAEAATALQSAIRAAQTSSSAFTTARVTTYSNRLMVIVTAMGNVVTFSAAPADSTTVSQLKLDSDGGVQANLQEYTLGSPTAIPNTAQGEGTPGNNGSPPDGAALIGDYNAKTGIYALRDVDLFNLLCIPRTAQVDTNQSHPLSESEAQAVMTVAEAYCEERRAFFLMDTPNTIDEPQEIQNWLKNRDTLRTSYAALYFPRVMIPDPLNNFRLRSVGASGTIAGLYARIDSDRGVWKAPAGTEAALRNVIKLEDVVTDPENGSLNPLAINCLRNFPVYGTVSWGARTLDGADQLTSEYKYIPVRRTVLFIEESLYRGLKWVVFEPNDEPLWAQIRLNVGAFMNNLFRQEAFQGKTSREAYLVKCDKETTTQNDINLGIVNILVGFAPLKPAEFVILKIQQLAGQIAT
jgi:hypothetical protein